MKGFDVVDTNMIFIILAVIVVILLLCFTVIKNNNKSKSNLPFEITELVDSLGGISNIVDCEAKLSKILVVLKDETVVNNDALTKLGASGLVLNNKGLTIIFGSISTDVEKELKILIKKP